MITIRKYRKLDWWDFLIVLDQELEKNPSKEVFLDLLDELRMRKIDSISEGVTFKLKAPTTGLINRYEVRMDKDADFASQKDLEDFKQLSELLL